MSNSSNDATPKPSNIDNPDNEYAIGYGKPPKENQFKPGQSGNPKGRRKKPKTAAEIAEKLLQQKVDVNVGGRKKRLPMLEVVMRSLTTKAAKGDLASVKLLMELLKSQQDGNTEAMDSILSEADSNELIESFIKQQNEPTQPSCGDE